MEAAITYSSKNFTEAELCKFINEGLQDQLTQRAKKDILDIGDYIAYTLNEPDISKIFGV